jgi:hypothetical protein
MQYVTLIPCLLCVVVLLRSGTRSAFLNAFLPVLLLLPTNFFLVVTHLPNLTFVDLTLIILGTGICICDLPRWKFTRMDIYVAVFIFSCGYSEWIHYGAWRAGALAVIEGLVPYMTAKLLLDQRDTYLVMIKRFTTLVAFASTLGIYEFVFKRNPFTYFWSHFYPGQWGAATTQIRGGFGRVAGPYTQSELAGIVIMAALLFALWVNRWYAKKSKFSFLAAHGLCNENLGTPMRLAAITACALAVCLYTTQARGPWVGAIVALAIASIGQARRPVLRSATVLVLGLLIGVPAYQLGKEYLSGPRTDYGSEKETAQYRAELIDNYIPLAESGGAWGLGRMVPIVRGQLSIDNEYLFIWLVQGYVGLVMLLLILIESMIAFCRAGLTTKDLPERQLLFTIFGVLAGISFIIMTVWLGAQSFEILFLLVGWSQAIVLKSRSVVRPSVVELEETLIYT